MEAGRSVENAWTMLYAAALRVVGSEDEAANSKQADRGGTHRAGLERRIEVEARQPRCAEPPSRFTQHEQFGMRGGVASGFDLIPRPRQHGTVRADHHCAHGNFAPGEGSAGLLERDLHRFHLDFLPRPGRRR